MPLGENKAEFTAFVCLCKSIRRFPRRSHSLAVLSSDAVRMRVPSGENAVERMLPLCLDIVVYKGSVKVVATISPKVLKRRGGGGAVSR